MFVKVQSRFVFRFVVCVVLFTLTVNALPVAAQRGAGNSGGAAARVPNAEKRVALVIGNGAYAHTEKLDNPVNDATDVAAALKDLGFEVFSGTNQSKRQMETLMRQFGERLAAAGGVGLFYYAGHGIQSGGRNYLIPVDAQIGAEDEIEYAAVDTNFVLGKMATAANPLNIVILDACRNNPFARQWRTMRDASSNGGLAQIKAPTGTLIVYATAPGDTASDGLAGSRNGLYTAELLAHMRKPDFEMTKMFQTVRAEVRRKSAGKQVPWESSSVEGDFFFAGRKTPQTPERAKPAGDTSAGETAFWSQIENSTDAGDFEAYLSEFPNGSYAAVARLKLRKLKTTPSVPTVKPSPAANSDYQPPAPRAGAPAERAFERLRMEDTTEAARLANEALAADRQNALALAVRGRELYLRFEHEAAFVDLEAAARIEPSNGIIRAWLAWSYSSIGNTTAARAAAREAVQLLATPKNADEFHAKAIAYGLLHEDEQKAAALSRAVEIDSRYAPAYVERGGDFSSFGNQDLERALAAFNKAIQANPKSSDAYAGRGGVYLEKKNFTQAEADYNKALELNPKNINAYFGLVGIFRERKQHDQMLTQYNRLIELNSQSPRFYLTRAGFYLFTLKDEGRALADYNKAIALNPNYASAYSSRANYYRTKKQVDLAFADYNRVIEIYPRRDSGYRNRASFYRFSKSDNESALRDLSTAIELDPEDSSNYIQRGGVYQEKNQIELAAADFNKAVQIDSRSWYPYYSRGDFYKRLKRYDDALADFTKVIEIDPTFSTGYSSRGDVYFERGLYDLAISDYTKAIEFLPESHYLYNDRAKAYEKKGDTARAAADRQRAAELEKQ